MLKTVSIIMASLLTGIALSSVHGQELSVEVIEGAPSADAISADLGALISDKGLRIKRGTRNVAEIWYCQQWPVDESFVGSAERLYPFTPGQLIGVLHLSRRGSEFRNQPVSSGWYTLRFGLQPVDGNHEGTSPTRDFLLIVEASKDAADKEWSTDDLNRASAEAIGSTHPAMLCLQPADDPAEVPSVRLDDFTQWWILRGKGTAVGAGGSSKDLVVDLVVEGHAAE